MKLLNYENYLAMIKNSVGSQAYRNVFALAEEEKKDILNDGRLSCAYFVSSLLNTFKLIGSIHVTVSSTVKDMLESGWTELAEPRPGAVIEWREIDYGPEGKHKHVGFYIGDNKAVSNDSENKKIVEHEVNFRGREVEKYYWHPKLEN